MHPKKHVIASQRKLAWQSPDNKTYQFPLEEIATGLKALAMTDISVRFTEPFVTECAQRCSITAWVGDAICRGPCTQTIIYRKGGRMWNKA